MLWHRFGLKMSTSDDVSFDQIIKGDLAKVLYRILQFLTKVLVKMLMVNILLIDQNSINDSQQSKHAPRYSFLVSNDILRGTTHLFTSNLSSMIIV